MEEELPASEVQDIFEFTGSFFESDDYHFAQKQFNDRNHLPEDIRHKLSTFAQDEREELTKKVLTRSFLGTKAAEISFLGYHRYSGKNLPSELFNFSRATCVSFERYFRFILSLKNKNYHEEYPGEELAAIERHDHKQKVLHDKAAIMIVQELIDQGVVPNLSGDELKKLYSDDETPSPPLGLGRAIVSLIIDSKLKNNEV